MEKVRINCDIELAYIREGQGFPIILIHGLDGNLASLCNLKDELKNDFDVIIYDVRGTWQVIQAQCISFERSCRRLIYIDA